MEDCPAPAFSSFVNAIAEGVHFLAQPITVLRATLEIASGNASEISQYQQALDTCLAESSRVLDAMGYVRELVRIVSDNSPRVQVDLAKVIAQVADDLQCVYHAARVALDARFGTSNTTCWAGAARVRQCLFYQLQHGADPSNAGCTIHLDVDAIGDVLSVRMSRETGASSLPEPQISQIRTSAVTTSYLNLAQVLAQKDGGLLEWSSEPFRIHLSYPTRAGTLRAAEASNHSLTEYPSQASLVLTGEPK